MAELTTQPSLPEWSAAFLSDRCEALVQQLLDAGAAPRRGRAGAVVESATLVIDLDADDPTAADEVDSIHCWRLLLLAAADLPAERQAPLEDLHLLHAQIAERLCRGGVADISPDVEVLIRSVLVDRLRRLTAQALAVVEGVRSA